MQRNLSKQRKPFRGKSPCAVCSGVGTIKMNGRKMMCLSCGGSGKSGGYITK